MDGALSLHAHAGAWKGEIDCIRIKSTLCGKAVWEDESERKRLSPPVLYGTGGFFTQAGVMKKMKEQGSDNNDGN